MRRQPLRARRPELLSYVSLGLTAHVAGDGRLRGALSSPSSWDGRERLFLEAIAPAPRRSPAPRGDGGLPLPWKAPQRPKRMNFTSALESSFSPLGCSAHSKGCGMGITECERMACRRHAIPASATRRPRPPPPPRAIEVARRATSPRSSPSSTPARRPNLASTASAAASTAAAIESVQREREREREEVTEARRELRRPHSPPQ